MVIPVVMYGCESWTVKKVEHRRNYAFELWYWRILLRVPWSARRSNQSILKEISPEISSRWAAYKFILPLRGQWCILISGCWHCFQCLKFLGQLTDVTRRSNQSILKEISPGCSLEGLKVQYVGHLMQRTDSLEKTLMLGKIEGGRRRDDRGWDGSIATPTWWTQVWVSSRSWWWTGKPSVLQSMGSQRVGHNWATGLNWRKRGGMLKTGSLTPTKKLSHQTMHEINKPWRKTGAKPTCPNPALWEEMENKLFWDFCTTSWCSLTAIWIHTNSTQTETYTTLPGKN